MQFCNILLTLAIVTAALYIQNGIHSQLDRVVFNATLHRAVPLLVGCVFQRRSPAEIAERGVGWVAIQMPALHAIGTRANKSFKNNRVNGFANTTSIATKPDDAVAGMMRTTDDLLHKSFGQSLHAVRITASSAWPAEPEARKHSGIFCHVVVWKSNNLATVQKGTKINRRHGAISLNALCSESRSG